MAGTSIVSLPQRQDDGWVDGEFDNESADDGTLSPPSPRVLEMTPNFEQLRQFDASRRNSPTRNTSHRPIPSQPHSLTGFPLIRSVEMATNSLDASRYQHFLPHQYPISPQNTPPEERIHLPCPLVISGNGSRCSSELPLIRSAEMAYPSLDRNGHQEFRMPPSPVSPQNTPTQGRIHLPIPDGSQPRSPTGSPLTHSPEMASPNLLYQEFHSIQFLVSAQNSPTQLLEQLPRQTSIHRHELTLSPIRNLEHLPCPHQTTGVTRALTPSGPVQQPSRNPGMTFDEHAILHPTLPWHGFTLPPMLNLDRPDVMPIPHLSDLETLPLAPNRVGMVADPTTDRIVASDRRTLISTPTLPRLASLNDITSARERGKMDLKDSDSMDTDSMGSDITDLDSMNPDSRDSDSIPVNDSMDWNSILVDFIEGGSGSN